MKRKWENRKEEEGNKREKERWVYVKEITGIYLAC